MGYAGNTFTYNQRGRIVTAVTSSGTSNYIYNALGQLIRDSTPTRTTLLMYDEAGHILGEYAGATGALIEETIWMGDIPVATLRPNAGSIKIYYVHTDHLGTPRKITNPTNNTVVWRWDPDTFGTAAPSIATLTYNLRFPGQYYQVETGNYYNYFRDYDPQTGRYVESDPIGLSGGSYSTYAYVGGNPLSWADPFGLYTEVIIWQPVTWGSSSFGHLSLNLNGTNYSWGPDGWDRTYPTAASFAARQEGFRSGTGVVLNLTPDQEARLAACLAKPRGKYSKTSNNCTTPAKDCLKEVLGYPISTSFFPVNVGNDLLDSPAYKGSTFYPGPNRSWWSNAPWAR